MHDTENAYSIWVQLLTVAYKGKQYISVLDVTLSFNNVSECWARQSGFPPVLKGFASVYWRHVEYKIVIYYLTVLFWNTTGAIPSKLE